MAELYQDLMIQEQEENERKRRILLEQEEKLAAEILRYTLIRSLVHSLSHPVATNFLSRIQRIQEFRPCFRTIRILTMQPARRRDQKASIDPSNLGRK